jgi:hypothetical protein
MGVTPTVLRSVNPQLHLGVGDKVVSATELEEESIIFFEMTLLSSEHSGTNIYWNFLPSFLQTAL